MGNVHLGKERCMGEIKVIHKEDAEATVIAK